MIQLSARFFGDTPQELRGKILDLGAECRDITPALPAIVTRFHMQMERRFKDEGAGGPAGRWAALTPGYKAWKEKRYPGKPILQLTGALKASLTTRGAGAVVDVGRNRVFIGSSIPYAPYHQTGTATMVARPEIDPSDRDINEWTVEVWRSLYKRTSKLGWKGRFSGAMS